MPHERWRDIHGSRRPRALPSPAAKFFSGLGKIPQCAPRNSERGGHVPWLRTRRTVARQLLSWIKRRAGWSQYARCAPFTSTAFRRVTMPARLAKTSRRGSPTRKPAATARPGTSSSATIRCRRPREKLAAGGATLLPTPPQAAASCGRRRITPCTIRSSPAKRPLPVSRMTTSADSSTRFLLTIR